MSGRPKIGPMAKNTTSSAATITGRPQRRTPFHQAKPIPTAIARTTGSRSVNPKYCSVQYGTAPALHVPPEVEHVQPREHPRLGPQQAGHRKDDEHGGAAARAPHLEDHGPD